MKKIITLGHPQSGYEQIQALLVSSGMVPAESSRRDNLTPQQITATLLKAHGVSPLEQVNNDETLAQIDVAPVWQGVVLDLMLSNIDNQIWGWADPLVVYLLDYWRMQDPQVIFVLVYDAPQTALTRLSLEEQATASHEKLQQRLEGWVAYNSAILQFYLLNPQRSVLMHSSQAQSSMSSYLNLINACVDSSSHLSLSESVVCKQDLIKQEALFPFGGRLYAQGADGRINIEDVAANSHAQLILSQLLETNPKAKMLYADLQVNTTVPLSIGLYETTTKNCLSAWQEFVQLYRCAERTAQLDLSKQHLERSHAKTLALQKKTVEENKSLLAKLNKIQKEFKQLQIVSQQSSSQNEAELEKVKQLLLAEQQSVLRRSVEIASVELKEENDLLLNQLCLVQVELERHFQESHKLKTPQVKMLYGAADRVKQQLSYRLGSTMIARSHSVMGWLGMPFALHEEARRFRRLQSERTEELPSIEKYSDVHEAERIKRHLSYRLGSKMITNSRSLRGWISMPWILLREVYEFKKERLAINDNKRFG